MDRAAAVRRVRVVVVVVAGVGVTVGAVTVLAVAARYGDLRFASRKTFAVGALLFGFTLLGRSGSVMAGEGVEAVQRHLDTATDWTEAKSRRWPVSAASASGGWSGRCCWSRRSADYRTFSPTGSPNVSARSRS